MRNRKLVKGVEGDDGDERSGSGDEEKEKQ